MSNNKQSSVDTNCINENYDKTFSGKMSSKKQISSIKWVFNKLQMLNIIDEKNYEIACQLELEAKAMHEQEIINAFNEGENNSVDYFNPESRINECKQYYNETFGAKQ